jgi:hypothetical protein
VRFQRCYYGEPQRAGAATATRWNPLSCRAKRDISNYSVCWFS